MRYTRSRWLLLILALAACHQAPPPEPGMKLGKPYVISGTTYYPEYDPTYDKIGMASWYGPGFHGKYTASGEIFNQNDLTAAHPTLPMPSLVRVTNLQNGRSLIVRINDRGPFKSNRIIDLSKRAAEKLGIRSTSEVRVQYLRKETQSYIASLEPHSGKKASMVAYNDRVEKAKENTILASTEPQIVESDDATTHAGQIVSEAAPVMTVSADNLDKPRAGQAHRLGLVKDAAADEVKVPAAAEALPATASDMPVRPAKGQYLIQVGSFAAEKNATKLKDKLEPIAAFAVDRIEMNGKVWWRVRLGPFPDKAAADGALQSVRAVGLPDARIMRQ